MKGTRNIILLGVAALVLILFVWGCSGCNSIKSADQGVKKAWGDVEASYQRRTNLYTSVIKVIEGSANFEKSTLREVIEARTKATSINVDINDPASLEKYQQAQAGLQSSFGRLLAIAENYPDIKTTQQFQNFQTQIEGTENRINVMRQDYNKAVEKFNLKIVKFPSSMLASMIGMKEKPYYKADPGTENPPDVQFNIK